MVALWIVLLVLALLAGWLLTLFSLPGNWLMLGAAALYAAFGPSQGRLDIGWGVVIVLAVLALLGEFLEFVAGALGAATTGAAKRSVVLAMVGSLTGGLLGVFVGLPIPLIGSIVAAILFSAIGALVGAVAGETWKGRQLEESWRSGVGAFWGRLLGTLGKAYAGSLMVALCLAALIF